MQIETEELFWCFSSLAFLCANILALTLSYGGQCGAVKFPDLVQKLPNLEVVYRFSESSDFCSAQARAWGENDLWALTKDNGTNACENFFLVKRHFTSAKILAKTFFGE